MAGLTNAFTKPRPKAHEKGFQVKRPPRPPWSTSNMWILVSMLSK
jgi:hypothetical protein